MTPPPPTDASDPTPAIGLRGREVLLGNYAPQPIALERGEGVWLWDSDGRRYLDLMGGIATTVLGHCHPKVRAALDAQADALWHVTNLYWQRASVELAERITRHSFAERVFFGNSGAEANEAALKLARRYHHARGNERFEIIAFDGGFHGRTLFTVSATGTPAYREGFEPTVPGIHFAPYGDVDATKALMSERTAAIIVEPVQGESGVRPAPPGFLTALRDLTRENGSLLVMDEIQSGMGRTGSLFAYEAAGIEPDVMTLAKALGNGIPIGAMCTTEAIGQALVPGTHGSTFGGNPLACACAVAVFDELTEGGVLEHGRAMGAYLDEQLRALAAELGPERIVDVRCAGLWCAIEMPGPAAPAIAACRDAGVLVISAGANNLRLAPALVIEREQIDEGVAVLRRVLADA